MASADSCAEEDRDFSDICSRHLVSYLVRIPHTLSDSANSQGGSGCISSIMRLVVSIGNSDRPDKTYDGFPEFLWT